MNIHTYFTYFTKLRHHCYWLGTARHKGDSLMPGKLSRVWYLLLHGYKLRPALRIINSSVYTALTYKKGYIRHETHPLLFLQELRATINKFKPDIIISQLESSDKVLNIANGLHIPTILFLTDAETSSLSGLQKIPLTTNIICVSKHVYSRVPKKFKTRTSVIYPPIQINDYKTHHHSPHQYITCVNPVRVKGGKILMKIIQQNPHTHFQIVKGWYDPIDDGYNFSQYPNVKILDRQSDMKSVYATTSALLVPSIWNEALPRVILEAGCNGIPSIATDRGGNHEAVGNGGILIKNPWNITEWSQAIHLVNSNTQIQKRISNNIRRHTKLFTIESLGKTLLIAIKKTILGRPQKRGTHVL